MVVYNYNVNPTDAEAEDSKFQASMNYKVNLIFKTKCKGAREMDQWVRMLALQASGSEFEFPAPTEKAKHGCAFL